MPSFLLVLLVLLLLSCAAHAQPPPPARTSIWDLIRGHGGDITNRFDTDPWDFDVFRALVELVPSVKTVLHTRTDITVFLPNDLACAQTANDLVALSANTTVAPTPVNTEQHAFFSLTSNWAQRYENPTKALELWLNYHIVSGAYSFQSVLELGSFNFNTLAQQPLNLVVTRLQHNDPRLANAEIAFAPPSQPTTQPFNGFVVVVDRMLFPSFSSLPLKPDAAQPLPSASSSISTAPAPSVSTTPSSTPKLAKSATPSPSATPIPASGPTAACFPSSSTVYLRRGVAVPLSTLRAGHQVLVSEHASSNVYLFSHRELHGVHSFIQVTSEHNHTIELTPGHYIYANGRSVAAATVNEGDWLRTVHGPSRVRRLRNVRATGLVAPHTLHGDIVINGVVASTYTTAVAPILAHSALAPLRYAVNSRLSLEPFGSLLYSGAPRVSSWLPSGLPFSWG